MHAKELKSIIFANNSKADTIEKDVFAYSSIEFQFIPKSISTLQESWCRETPKLVEIKVMHENENIIHLDYEMI